MTIAYRNALLFFTVMLYPALANANITSTIQSSSQLSKNLIDLAPSIHTFMFIGAAFLGLMTLGFGVIKIYQALDESKQAKFGVTTGIVSVIVGAILLQMGLSLDIVSTSVVGSTFSWSNGAAVTSTTSPEKLAGTAAILFLQIVGVFMSIKGFHGLTKLESSDQDKSSLSSCLWHIVGGAMLANIILVGASAGDFFGSQNLIQDISVFQ